MENEILSRATKHLFALVLRVDLASDILRRLSCINWRLVATLRGVPRAYYEEDVEAFIRRVCS